MAEIAGIGRARGLVRPGNGNGGGHEIHERLARIEIRMESVASREDVAAIKARMESMAFREDVAEIKARMESMASREDVAAIRTQMESMASREDVAAIRTLIEEKETRTLRWLIGVTVAASISLLATLLRTLL